MLIRLVNALKDVLRLTDAEISKKVGISTSSLVKHRAAPEEDFNPKSAGAILKLLNEVFEKNFPNMTPEERLFLWRELSIVVIALDRQLRETPEADPHFNQRKLNRAILGGIASRIWKKYIHDGENLHPDWL